MKTDFVLEASLRSDMGKGASRRLRREGKVPVIIYGAHKEATPLTVNHNELFHQLENEVFYSSVLTIKVDGKAEQAVLKDLQRHPHRQLILHADFQRISAGEKIRMHVPLHFVGGDVSPGVKIGGGVVIHEVNEIEISCLPKDLPDFIEVDLSGCELGQIVHMSDVKLPAGIELVSMSHGHDLPLSRVQTMRGGASVDVDEAAEGEGEGEGEKS
ncbi:MAG: 50S ribosomal protein L25/general stress protein Ctc [Thiohalomonadaceae bacterium]